MLTLAIARGTKSTTDADLGKSLCWKSNHRRLAQQNGRRKASIDDYHGEARVRKAIIDASASRVTVETREVILPLVRERAIPDCSC
jgi:hypothetical protein